MLGRARSAPEPATAPPLLTTEDEAGIRRYLQHLSRGAEAVQRITALAFPSKEGPYCVWDVETDKGRWWVIAPPLNLYAQELVPGLDYVMALHHALFEGAAGRELN